MGQAGVKRGNNDGAITAMIGRNPQILLTVTPGMVLLLCAHVAMAACSKPSLSQKATITLEKALLLERAATWGLDERSAVRLVVEFGPYQMRMHELWTARASLVQELEDATQERAAEIVLALKRTGQALWEVRHRAHNAMAPRLQPVPQAHLYLFLMAMGPKEVPLSVPGFTHGRPHPGMAVAGAHRPAAPAPAPSDYDRILAVVDRVKLGLESRDIEALLATFAPSFEYPEVGGKTEARRMLQLGMDMGYADGGKVITRAMEVKIAEDRATVYPIVLSSHAGTVTVELVLGKKEGAWLIETLRVDGL